MRVVLPYSLKDWPIRQPPPSPEFFQLGAAGPVAQVSRVWESPPASPEACVPVERLLPPVGPEDSASAQDVFARVVARLFS